MRIGIMGGSFDPIHNGHIAVADAVYKELKLNKVLFMPSGNPPHKKLMTDGQVRLDMIKLALKDYDYFEASDYELCRKGTIYTADTLVSLRQKYPENEYTFIIGADSLFYLKNWYRPDIILQNAEVAVCARDNSSLEMIEDSISDIKKIYNDATVHVVDFECVDISSNEIRQSIYTNEELCKYIPEDVYSYIVRKGLYKNEV